MCGAYNPVVSLFAVGHWLKKSHARNARDHNERSAEAATERKVCKMVIREIPHCCQKDDCLHFISTKFSDVCCYKGSDVRVA